MSDPIAKRRTLFLLFLVGLIAAVLGATFVVRRSKARDRAASDPVAPSAPKAAVHMAVGDSAPETPIPGEPEPEDAESL